MGKIAIITGPLGQDGFYLSELLLKKGYKVFGVYNSKKKITQKTNFSNKKNLKYIKIDINNFHKVKNLIKKVKPNEFYHLAAQSFINYKFEDEFFKLNPNINGTHYILSAIKEFSPKTRFYFAASSEMFGNTTSFPQNENTKFNPRSAYGISKVAGYYLTKNYRDAYNIYACSGILYNHESPRRNINFVTRKITNGIALILEKKIKKIKLGNINAKRDWGHAKDYVYAMWKMLQLKKPEDFVIGTGKLHSVKDFLKISFKLVNLNYKNFISIDKKFYRPNDKYKLVANYTKAKKILKWTPKISFKSLINDMLLNELSRLKK